MPTLEAAGSMLAPYAAMMNKQQKLQVRACRQGCVSAH
jgi:hypothetical protein